MQTASTAEHATPQPARSAARKKWLPLVYFVLGQVAWFACVLSAARGVPWIGIAVTAALIALHILFAARPLDELKLLAAVALIGGVWDSAVVHFGLLSYPSGTLISGAAPDWIIALWASFAAQLNATYRWLRPHKALAALLGAVAGPLSFRAGAAMGALQFVKPWPAAAALAIGWAVILPLLIFLSQRWDGVRLEQG